MTKIIAISNQKGGVGKTTTTLSLGAALAELGKRVLLVDLDQQGSLTHSTGYDPEELDETIYTILSSLADLKQKQPVQLSSVIKNISKNLDLAPANGELAALDLELDRAYNREYILSKVLDTQKTTYDYILLDCPPSLSLLVVNALVASTDVIIPLQADYLATKGVKRLLEIIEAVQARLNPKLHIEGIVLTMADNRTAHTREVIDSTRTRFQGKLKVFDAVIKMSVRLKETPVSGKSILEYDPSSEAAAAYRKLAREVENG
ncbi:MAG: sporulation initiation inhibitor protein Soj [Chamaesiphon sp.]